MSDWLSNPLSLFDIKGQVAIVTGASGAFGALAAKVLAGAGCRLVLAAGKQAELDAIASACAETGAEVEPINLRPSSEENCAQIVGEAVARFGRVDILVVASGKNDVSKIHDMAPARFLDVLNRTVYGNVQRMETDAISPLPSTSRCPMSWSARRIGLPLPI